MNEQRDEIHRKSICARTRWSVQQMMISGQHTKAHDLSVGEERDGEVISRLEEEQEEKEEKEVEVVEEE